MIFTVPDNIEDFSTVEVTVELPSEDILRQHVYGVLADLTRPENFDPLLDEAYRWQLAILFTKVLGSCLKNPL